MRDRLIELLLSKSCMTNECPDVDCEKCECIAVHTGDAGKIADHLLENGVIVPPCKVGDTVWEIHTENPFEEDLQVMETKVEKFFIGTSLDIHCIDGKTLFLTREEAEAKLKGGEG